MTARSKEYVKVPTSDIESLGDGFSSGLVISLSSGGVLSSDASSLVLSGSGAGSPNGKSAGGSGEGYSPVYQVLLCAQLILLFCNTV
jgi:hypothetical protein